MAGRVRKTFNNPPDATDVVKLENSLIIDEHALEACCSEHPDLYYQVAKLLALETSRRDESINHLKDAEAECDATFREDAAKAGDKITEKAVEAYKRTDRTVQAMRAKLAVFERSVGQLAALTEAYRQRGYMLKELVQLHISSYYGDVSVKGNRAQLQDVRVEHARKELREARRDYPKRGGHD